MKNDADMERGIITITENGTVTMPTAPVWMTQQEMCDAFNVFGCDIRKAVHAIYKNMELFESETKRYIRQDNGINYDVYSLEMVIAVSFKWHYKIFCVNGKYGIQVRVSYFLFYTFAK